MPSRSTSDSGCGDGPACDDGLSCVEHYPIADRPGPPAYACEQTCSFAGDECPAGQMCAMESAGPGFVCRPDEPPEPEAGIARLVQLAEIWSAVRFTHPWLAYRDIDWGRALVGAIPKARATSSEDAFRGIVAHMLGALGDPATRIDTPVEPSDHATPPLREEDGILVVTMNQVRPFGPGTSAEVTERIAGASRIVFDMRRLPGGFVEYVDRAFEAWNAELLAEEVVLPSRRSRVIHGFAPERGRTSGRYYQAFETAASATVSGTRSEDPPRVVFVVDDAQVLPTIALPLWESGRGSIIADRPLDERAMASAQMLDVPLAGGYVQIRKGEVVDAGRRPILNADVVTTDDPIAKALGRLGRNARTRRRRAERAPLPLAVHAPPSSSAPERVPGLAERMHNAIDLWSTLDRFQAYTDRRPRWDAALAKALASMDEADDWESYSRVMMELNASVDDGHSVLRSPQITAMRGTARMPFESAVVQGCLVVTGIRSSSSADGLQVGDVIESIDGRPFSERFAELAPLVAASTPEAHRLRIATELLRGEPDVETVLVVDRDGERVELTVRRTIEKPPPDDSPTVTRIEDGTIGLVDLSRLTRAEVPAMFEQLADTEAIIFDLRGYPRGTAWSIAPYLDQHPGATAAAQIRRPRVAAPPLGSDLHDARTSYFQLLPEADVTRYDGTTLMLTNSRTISQAEHTGLFFEAANGTRFVGTPSAGANGDVTTHLLPDGTMVAFTGQAISSPNGRPLQRVGLPLTLRVEPTIEGIRANRDEVLEAAVELLQSE